MTSRSGGSGEHNRQGTRDPARVPSQRGRCGCGTRVGTGAGSIATDCGWCKRVASHRHHRFGADGGCGRSEVGPGRARDLFSSRNPDQLAELVADAGSKAQAGLPGAAAAFGEVVLIAVPYGALPQVGRDYAALMQGKVVIDCGNPREDRDGPMAADAIERGTGVASAEYLPGVRLVRAFNAVASTMVRDAPRVPERIAIPIAADDQEAIEVTSGLVEDAGFDPVLVGGLERAREFDRGTPVYVRGMSAVQLREALNLAGQES